MYRKLIINDIKKSKMTTATITLFILLAACLTSLAAMLAVNLTGAIDGIMVKAKTPHFMQMHAGEIDNNRLNTFIDGREEVEAFQILEFLNIDGTSITIGDQNLATSIQDNGLAVQSKAFDFLIDLDSEIIYPSKGEIYVPVYYMKELDVALGDTVRIHDNELTVAGFIRDSQMNAALISSKRFLVNPQDFAAIKPEGKIEQLIEVRLKDSSKIAPFEAAYLKAGLEANGPPAITYSLIKLANGISDGIMIAVLVLISVLVILVTFLCIRLTLLTKTEDDYKEIGILKAIGLRVSQIKKLYLAKYGMIALLASVGGFLLAFLLQKPFSENIRLYMGDFSQDGLAALCGVLSVVLIFGVILLYVNRVLSRFKKISAVEAIRFGTPNEKTKNVRALKLSQTKRLSRNVFLGLKDVLVRKKLYITMLFVLIISAFMMIVPQNMHNTISSRNFMTYMGIGNSYMRVDIQQTDDILADTGLVADTIAKDPQITQSTVLISRMFDSNSDDGTTKRLKVELGDHSVFPIEYSQGRGPETESEIAVSNLALDDLEKGIGDTISLTVDGVKKDLTISGSYSDVTNGGKTAKGLFESNTNDILWSVIPIVFEDNSLVNQKVSEYQEKFPFAKVSNIDDYINQTFGATTTAIKKASQVSIVAAILLMMMVTLLFMKMLIAKDKHQIAILKSLGFKSAEIRHQYLVRVLVILVLGVTVGTVLANTLGEVVGAALISSFGISSLTFEINPLFAYIVSPLVMASSVFLATTISLLDIDKIKISSYIKE